MPGRARARSQDAQPDQPGDADGAEPLARDQAARARRDQQRRDGRRDQGGAAPRDGLLRHSGRPGFVQGRQRSAQGDGRRLRAVALARNPEPVLKSRSVKFQV